MGRADSNKTNNTDSHKNKPDPEDDIPWTTLLFIYMSFIVNISFGYIREYSELIGELLFSSASFEKPAPGFAPLLRRKEYFYTRRLFARIRDCWDRPICSAPGPAIDVVKRAGMDKGTNMMNETLAATNESRKDCLNLGSYNYLGFAENNTHVTADVIAAIQKYGIASASPKAESGSLDLHVELEKNFANFIGKEDCVIFGMGYATNSTTIPALASRGCLILSDSLNHASIVAGCRASGAVIKTFKHNIPEDLERVIKQSLLEGQPKTHRDWKKILIIIEGIYSMEGEIARLAEIVEIKKKYKCYLYVDEAHSIGALGPHAKGICDHTGVNPADVDILMGTFTKSFGSVGGYIAGSTELITYLRQASFGPIYTYSMPAACTQQILSALNEMRSEDGKIRIQKLKDNSNYFRTGLVERGFRIIGDPDSPVVPLMIYHPLKTSEFSRLCLQKNIAVVVVGFPATSLLGFRARFCVSASHSKEQLDIALGSIEEIGSVLYLQYDK
eukprot:TRINITY_DN1262_c0_g1_i1.p1 TRINITY_DN1262_c0_g1~~TRINITY_DN1262_c0_g1_i1.p1  ORF type:complete len:502 (-),score=105.66 TRINITY_DN1262_c0_g1_i1:15-1520(-)